MSFENLAGRLSYFAQKCVRIQFVHSTHAHYFKLLAKHGIRKKKLTKEQKKQIDAVWKGSGRFNYKTHILHYSVTGEFIPEVVPMLLFCADFELKLNQQSFKRAWADKGYFSFFFPKEYFPETIVCNVNGIFYDEDYNLLPKEDVLKKLKEQSEYVVKPTLDSGGGSGVALFQRDVDPEDVFKKYKKNYIIQKRLQQYGLLSSFNASSVNVIRFISLFIDGEVLLISATLRCGAEGAFNDASITDDGMGMFVIGITEEGVLKDTAYHSCGKKIFRCPNGVEFAGKQIPNFEKIKQIVMQLHKQMAYFGFVGWDFCIDHKGNPRIMEYNIKSPGVLYYQYANGGLFGKYTQKVLQWMKKH